MHVPPPPPPIVRSAPVAGALRVVVSRARRGLRVELRIAAAGDPPRLVILGVRRRRIAIATVPSTTYRVRARACRRARTRRCSRWTRPTTTGTPAPRVVGAAGPPPMGDLPALGFNDSAYADNHPADFFRDVHDLGGTIARRIVWWPELEPDGPTPDTTRDPWRRIDAFVDHAAAAGVTVTLELGGVPEWANTIPADARLGAAPAIPAWRGFVDLLSARVTPAGTAYASVVKRWGWNEADCCNRSTYLPPAAQRDMLASVYALLHARIAGVDVMANAGCPCGFGDVGATQAQIIRYLARRELATGERVFDTVSVHLYPSLYGRAHGWEPESAPTAFAYTTADMGRIVRELDADFRRRVDFDVTETGWMTTGGYHDHVDAKTGALVGLSEDCQARAALHELGDARRYTPRLKSFEWFLIRDQAARPTTNAIYVTGLEHSDGSPKALRSLWPAYVAAPPATDVVPCHL